MSRYFAMPWIWRWKAEAKAKDLRARRTAQRAGLQARKVGGRFTLTRSRGVEAQGLTARDALRWAGIWILTRRWNKREHRLSKPDSAL